MIEMDSIKQARRKGAVVVIDDAEGNGNGRVSIFVTDQVPREDLAAVIIDLLEAVGCKVPPHDIRREENGLRLEAIAE